MQSQRVHKKYNEKLSRGQPYPKGSTQTESESMENDAVFNCSPKTSRSSYLIFIYSRLQAKSDKRQGCLLHIDKRNNSTEEIIISIYAPNINASSFVKQKLLNLKGHQQNHSGGLY